MEFWGLTLKLICKQRLEKTRVGGVKSQVKSGFGREKGERGTWADAVRRAEIWKVLTFKQIFAYVKPVVIDALR